MLGGSTSGLALLKSCEEKKMSEEQARQLISMLTYEEKVKLNEMLKALEQKRQPSPTPPGLAS